MENPLIRKLERFVRLSAEDKEALIGISDRTRHVERHADIIRDGEQPDYVSLIMEGIACRYKLSENGERQIVAYLVPGDLCDIHIFILKQMDHSIGALTPITMIDISRQAMLDLLRSRPALTEALWWSSLVDSATLREWIFNVGMRTSYERTAHLLCELFVRLETVGLTDGIRGQVPLTQEELSDAVGVGRTHVNKTLQELQDDGLVELRRSSIEITDIKRLMQAGGFSANYLHLERPVFEH
jgi:CRP-like cAMP-binding protein